MRPFEDCRQHAAPTSLLSTADECLGGTARRLASVVPLFRGAVACRAGGDHCVGRERPRPVPELTRLRPGHGSGDVAAALARGLSPSPPRHCDESADDVEQVGAGDRGWLADGKQPLAGPGDEGAPSPGRLGPVDVPAVSGHQGDLPDRQTEYVGGVPVGLPGGLERVDLVAGNHRLEVIGECGVAAAGSAPRGVGELVSVVMRAPASASRVSAGTTSGCSGRSWRRRASVTASSAGRPRASASCWMVGPMSEKETYPVGGGDRHRRMQDRLEPGATGFRGTEELSQRLIECGEIQQGFVGDCSSVGST